MSTNRRDRFRWGLAGLLLLGILLMGPAMPLRAQPPRPQSPPSWLEPRALNLADLVGLVPEAQLQDAIIAYSGVGIVQYVSGNRNGNTVTLQVRITPRYSRSGGLLNTHFNCLGQTGIYDHWSSTVPEARMRLYADGGEITDQIRYINVTPAGWVLPTANTGAGFRYAQTGIQPATFAGDGSLVVPANMGCEIVALGYHTNLTATFILETTSPIQVTVLGQEQFSFHSYIGPGNAGQLEALRSQMQARYPGIRHDKFPLQIPPAADYILVTYPPTPADAYPLGGEPMNVPLESSGTYRLVADQNALSTDHTHSAGLPIQGQWRDADQAGDSVYLPQLPPVLRLASPEYFLPSSVAYDPCMIGGGCPDSLLQQIYDATMPLTVTYYAVRRSGLGLTQIPLRQVGPKWSPGAARGRVPGEEPAPLWLPGPSPAGAETIFLPLVVNAPTIPPDDPAGCPCGWFDELGRMLDFVPGP